MNGRRAYRLEDLEAYVESLPNGSVGESNAVFLRGVGGDAATEPHKTGCSGYPEEEFSGTHKLSRPDIALAGLDVDGG